MNKSALVHPISHSSPTPPLSKINLKTDTLIELVSLGFIRSKKDIQLDIETPREHRRTIDKKYGKGVSLRQGVASTIKGVGNEEIWYLYPKPGFQ